MTGKKRFMCNGVPFDTWAEANRERNLTGGTIGFAYSELPSCQRHKHTTTIQYKTTTKKLADMLQAVL